MSAQETPAFPLGPEALAEATKSFERMMQRNVKGLEYIRSPAPVVGISESETLIDRGTLQLLHYTPLVEEVYRVPVVLVMATTNRGYIFDLREGQSYVEYLLKAGFDVFVIDWEPPRDDERGLGMADYVLDFIPSCIERICRETGEDEVSVIGYCMGGVLSLIYAALHTDGPAKNLMVFTTPLDMTKMTGFHNWSDKRFFDVDRILKTYGNCPPELIYGAFDLLSPADKTAGNLRLWENMWNDEFVESYRLFDRWANDILPLAGEYFADTIRGLMWENGLYEGKLQVAARTADIAKIEIPFFMATAVHDSIVPSEASAPLIDKIGSADKEHLELKGGHVSVIAGPNAVKRLWPATEKWLGKRSV